MDKLCQIRDLQRQILAFETSFNERYGLVLNEGMLLCSLQKSGELSSGALASLLGLSHSNISKVLKSVEQKGLIDRELGIEDRRQMYFRINRKGLRLLRRIQAQSLDIPTALERILEA